MFGEGSIGRRTSEDVSLSYDLDSKKSVIEEQLSRMGLSVDWASFNKAAYMEGHKAYEQAMGPIPGTSFSARPINADSALHALTYMKQRGLLNAREKNNQTESEKPKATGLMARIGDRAA